jgi:hypothetical protein
MANNSLYPAFGVVNYRTFKALHKQTLPLLNWFPTPNVGEAGAISQWDAGTIDAFDMIHDLYEFAADVVPNTTTFLDFVIYTMDTPTSVPQPVASKALGITGTLTGDPVAASQATMLFRTTLFGLYKFVLLDIQPPPDFQDVFFADFSAENLAISDYLTDVDNGFSGRDGGRPATPLKISYTLNDGLQKTYRRR